MSAGDAFGPIFEEGNMPTCAAVIAWAAKRGKILPDIGAAHQDSLLVWQEHLWPGARADFALGVIDGDEEPRYEVAVTRDDPSTWTGFSTIGEGKPYRELAAAWLSAILDGIEREAA